MDLMPGQGCSLKRSSPVLCFRIFWILSLNRGAFEKRERLRGGCAKYEYIFLIGNILEGKECGEMKEIFGIRGQICFSKSLKEVCTVPDGIVICEDGRCQGVFSELPEKYKGIPVEDYGDTLIFPGLSDLHMHASQYWNRGRGMDLELIPWLNEITFPEEKRYENEAYAREAYQKLVSELVAGPNTRVCVFAVSEVRSTHILMELLEKSGMAGMVGKVNMDRNVPEYICEESAAASVENTKHWIEESLSRYKNIRPILTPRFTPACSDELMVGLSHLQKKYHLPLQSHLSENVEEIRWVKKLCPEIYCYGESYDRYSLFGSEAKTVMAHCVHSSEDEVALIKKRGVYVAHCPDSNTNLSSGIAPIRDYLTKGLRVGLGSDISSGCHTSMLRAMASAIKVSKLYYSMVKHRAVPLRFEEVFYMATVVGGSFFGKVGSFQKDYEFDAVVLADDSFPAGEKPAIRDRMEMAMYLSDDRNIIAKYVKGRKIK